MWLRPIGISTASVAGEIHIRSVSFKVALLISDRLNTILLSKPHAIKEAPFPRPDLVQGPLNRCREKHLFNALPRYATQ
jgi:hypothetical protein